MTKEQLAAAQKKLGLKHKQMAKLLGCSLRFYMYRLSGKEPIPLMMEAAVKYFVITA